MEIAAPPPRLTPPSGGNAPLRARTYVHTHTHTDNPPSVAGMNGGGTPDARRTHTYIHNTTLHSRLTVKKTSY